jgi:hypothetical protein
LLVVVLAAGSVTFVGCKEEVRQEPPLLLAEEVSQEPPLLLEEGSASEEFGSPTGPVADNSRCHVCHMNYEDEALSIMHARANVGCEQCHGASDAHCSDEDNITPPDIMYPAHKINSFCKSCHPKAKLGGDKKYCVDCHGEHRLTHRTRKWDKATGNLVEDDKVRMLTDEMLEQK